MGVGTGTGVTRRRKYQEGNRDRMKTDSAWKRRADMRGIHSLFRCIIVFLEDNGGFVMTITCIKLRGTEGGVRRQEGNWGYWGEIASLEQTGGVWCLQLKSVGSGYSKN